MGISSDNFIAKVAKTIEENRMLERGEGVVVGVSGGPDSVALLHLLSRLREKWSLKLMVAHCNHGLRGEESERDEEFVRKISELWGIPFEAKRFDCGNLKKRWRLSTQEAARRVRYGFFDQISERYRFQKIALAHHKDDQVESVLIALIRGSGSRGLRGIPYKRNKGIIRPLMEVRKEEILEYLTDNGLDYVEDRTNQELSYLRNKIRHVLVPLLKQWNPRLEEGLMRFSLLQKRDDDFLSELAQEAFQKVFLFEKDKTIGCDLANLASLHPSIRGRLIRYCLERMTPVGLWGISFSHVEAVLGLIEKGATGSQIHLPRDIVVEKGYQQLIFKMGKEEKAGDFCYSVSIPGDCLVPEAGLQIVFEIVDRSDPFDFDLDKKIQYMDAAVVQSPLYVRSIRPGDRFRPLGLGGSKKLKDFFIDEKIPREKRKTIPILAGNKEIVWVVGLRVDERFKVNRLTKQMLRAIVKEA